MDRIINYPGAIPLDTDLLSSNKNAMVALGWALQAVLGTSTFADGLTCTPNSPAALNVLVAPGAIYSLQNTDGTAYGSLPADTTHQLVKQGLLLDAVTLATPAPATTGQSVAYLIQAAYADSDTAPVVMPYYNAADPSVAYSGPANSGTAQNTVRKGVCLVSAKAGVAAATGTQTAPAPDAGYVGLYTVTVANGQTAVTGGNIAPAAGAPFVGAKLTGRLSAAGNLADLTNAATAVANLGMADSQAANGYKKLGRGLILQWATSGTVAAGGGLTGSWPVAMTTLLWASANMVATSGSATAINVAIGGGTAATTYDLYNLGNQAAIARVLAVGIL